MVEYQIVKIVGFAEKNVSFWKSSSTLDETDIIHNINITKPFKRYRVSVALVNTLEMCFIIV